MQKLEMTKSSVSNLISDFNLYTFTYISDCESKKEHVDNQEGSARKGQDVHLKGNYSDDDTNDYVLDVVSRGVDDVQEDPDINKEKPSLKTKDIREVDKNVELVPFVFVSCADVEENVWPEEELIVRAAKELDLLDREEELSRANCSFWAEQILKDCINEGIERRKRLTRWTKSIKRDSITGPKGN